MSKELRRLDVAQKFAIALEHARLGLGVTQAEMAERMGMSASGYKKVVSGETTKIDLVYALRLHALTGWRVSEMLDSDSPEAVLLANYRTLRGAGKRFVEAVAAFEARAQAVNAHAADMLTVLVPTGDMQDGMIYDSANVIQIDAAPYFQQFGGRLHCGIQVTSNHLHPVYHVGDVLLICCEPIRDGDTGVFFHKASGRVYLRKFHQTRPCVLEPINGYGRTFTVDPEDLDDMSQWIKYGYVLSRMRA